MKKFTALILTGVMVISSVCQVLAENDVSPVKIDTGVYIDGQYMADEIKPVQENGRILVPARSFLNEIGAKLTWNQEEKRLAIQKANIGISLTAGDTNLQVNNVTKEMDAYPVIIDNSLMVPIRFLAEALNYTVSWNPAENSVDINTAGTGTAISRGETRPGFVVVIDPGHGGDETGAVYGGIDEKDLNIDIANRLNALLKKQGIKTYMTRTDDSYVGLYERSGLANKVNADLLISIHNNAGESGTSGSMALYCPSSSVSKGDLTSKSFASIVEDALTGDLNTVNMGVIARPHLAVLRTSKVPAVIAEVAYMTNKSELVKLKSDSFKQKAAAALKDAVLAALKKI